MVFIPNRKLGENLLKFFVLLALVFLSLYSNENFKINKIERDLINPEGTIELTSLYSTTLKKHDNDDLSLDLRYSFSKRLEFVFLGANYLFYNDDVNDYVAGVRFIGGESSNGADGTTDLAFDFQLKGKNRFLDNKYALEYHAIYRHVFRSSGKDEQKFEFLIEPMISINQYVSFSLSSRYIYRNGTAFDSFTDIKYYDVGCNLYVNVNKYIEFYVKYAHFNHSSSSSFAFTSSFDFDYDFLNKNGNRIGFGGSFRFFF